MRWNEQAGVGYTLLRSSPNSRVKDLVDLALLTGDNRFDRAMAFNALRHTFERRKTHALPSSLKAPPEEWQTPFHALAKECGLRTDIVAVFEHVHTFFGTIEHLSTQER